MKDNAIRIVKDAHKNGSPESSGEPFFLIVSAAMDSPHNKEEYDSFPVLYIHQRRLFDETIGKRQFPKKRVPMLALGFPREQQQLAQRHMQREPSSLLMDFRASTYMM